MGWIIAGELSVAALWMLAAMRLPWENAVWFYLGTVGLVVLAGVQSLDVALR